MAIKSAQEPSSERLRADVDVKCEPFSRARKDNVSTQGRSGGFMGENLKLAPNQQPSKLPVVRAV